MCATAQIENSAQLPLMLDHRTFPEHRQLLQARQRWILETEEGEFSAQKLEGREEQGGRGGREKRKRIWGEIMRVGTSGGSWAQTDIRDGS